ncbi:MAG: enoyl-CoA hydratase/isomerase family protein [Terriglobales bacterium]
MVATEHENGVAVVTIDNPPVNALGAGVPEGIDQAIKAAESDRTVNAIVLIGAGGTFVAGADIKQLEDLAWGKVRVRRTYMSYFWKSKTAQSP